MRKLAWRLVGCFGNIKYIMVRSVTFFRQPSCVRSNFLNAQIVINSGTGTCESVNCENRNDAAAVIIRNCYYAHEPQRLLEVLITVNTKNF